MTGTVSEDNQFVFESAWSGMVMDLGVVPIKYPQSSIKM